MPLWERLLLRRHIERLQAVAGEKLQRELYTRAPKEGLPAVGSRPAVKPFGLLEILKGAYGLTEAPRLWYLKAKNLLEGIGAVELKIARACFVFRGKNKTGTSGMIAILSLKASQHMNNTKNNKQQKRFMIFKFLIF